MIYKETAAKIIFQQSDALGKMLGTNAGCEFVKLEVKPGGVIKPHSLDVDVTFFIINGTGDLKLDGRNSRASFSDLVSVKAGVMREWKNVGTENLTVLVIKHLERPPGRNVK